MHPGSPAYFLKLAAFPCFCEPPALLMELGSPSEAFWSTRTPSSPKHLASPLELWALDAASVTQGAFKQLTLKSSFKLSACRSRSFFLHFISPHPSPLLPQPVHGESKLCCCDNSTYVEELLLNDPGHNPTSKELLLERSIAKEN